MPRTSLEQEIHHLTQAFTRDVFTAVRAGLDNLFAVDDDRGRSRAVGRRFRSHVGARTTEEQARELLQSKGFVVRRSSEELHKLANEIIAIVSAHPKCIGAEAIKDKMGFAKGQEKAKVFAKPLSLALASRKIRKSGQRRATLYFAA